MESFSSHLLSTVGKSAASPEVQSLIQRYGLFDTYDDPPFCRYVGSKAKGVDLLLENDRVVDIQIYVLATKAYSAFQEPLPFGIQRGMSQKQIHQLLGQPVKFDEFDSNFLAPDIGAVVTAVYDSKGIVRYVSVGSLES